jgi:hypothetical protein
MCEPYKLQETEIIKKRADLFGCLQRFHVGLINKIFISKSGLFTDCERVVSILIQESWVKQVFSGKVKKNYSLIKDVKIITY